MDAINARDARVMRLERKVERLERELKDAKKKASADLAAERRRSQYKIARVLNRKRERTAAEPSECMICDERQGNIHHCKGPCACKNVICGQCANDPRFDRRCLMCRGAGLNGLEQMRHRQSAGNNTTNFFVFGSTPSGENSQPPDCTTQ